MLVLLFLGWSFASELPPPIPAGDYISVLEIRDVTNALPMANSTVRFTLTKGNESEVLTERTGENGVVVIFVDEGNWDVQAEIDYPETAGSDFLGRMTMGFFNDTNKTFPLQPVGTVYGEVMYKDSPIAANLTLSCISSAYDPNELNRNLLHTPTGFFSLRVPAGGCTISAETAAGTGFASASVGKGGAEEAKIPVGEMQAPLPGFNLAVAAGLSAFLLLIWLLRMNRSKAEAEKKKQRPEAAGKKKAVKEIRMPAGLNAREKKVVRVIIEKDGKAKQSLIYRETLIPKTSLARVIQSLEERGIVNVHPFGKTRIIELREWE